MSLAVVFERGWEEFSKFFHRRTSDRLHEELRLKLREQLVLLRADVVDYVRSARHGVMNSPLTILTKRGNRPLIDRNYLLQGVKIGIEETGSTRSSLGRSMDGGIGVRWGERNATGRPLWLVATSLHEGMIVRVTPAVRTAVYAAMRERGKGRANKYTKGVKLTGEGGASTWRIRARPFLRVPFEAAHERIRVALGEAVTLTLQKR